MSESEKIPLEQTNSFYRHLFDAAPDLLLMIGEDGEVQIANSRCEDVLGHSAEAMKGKRVQDLLVGRNASVFEVVLRGVLDGTTMPEDEVLVQTAGGDAVAMMLDIRPMEGAESNFILVRLRDLSEIKVLEQEYRNLFDSIGDAVFIGDPDSGRIYQANRQAYELTGYASGELFEEEYDEVHSESWDAIREELDEAGGEELSGREMNLVRKDGEKVPVGLHLRIAARGQERIYIETAFDISERKALEARMRELRAEWDAFVRHELRNPLTPIIAFSQILIEDYDDLKGSEKVPQYLEAIYQGGKRLEHLLDMTREVQAYEQGRILLEPFPVNIYASIDAAIQDAEMGVETGEPDQKKRVLLEAHEGAGERPDLPIVHDSAKIQRAVANLVKNALEHDPGDITVRVLDAPESVSVSVHNWGNPIPEDRLSMIFEKFNTTKRDQKGTGLGTTIAKLFVEAHDGRIRADSSEEEGTTFTITLPRVEMPTEQESEADR